MKALPLEWRLAAFAVAGAAPAVALIVVVALLPVPVWAAAAAAGGALLAAAACATLILKRAGRGFERIAGLIHGVRDGEYGLRSRPERGSFGRTLAAVNTLAADLAGMQRAGIESDALLGKLLSGLDLALFVFDPGDRVIGANPAAGRLLGYPAEALSGRHADELGLAGWLAAPVPLRESRHFPGGDGPWEIRVARFRRGGRPHRLLVVTDLSQALREEERRAWRGLIRVLAHETSNSLGPIQSTADTLARRLGKADLDEVTRAAVLSGLDLVERRSKSLSEFIHRYADLARLPAPQPRTVDLAQLLNRIASLERRLVVATAGPEHVTVEADPTQLEQALINLVKNAVDAALEIGGGVQMRWSEHAEGTLIEIIDEGPGLPDSENLFVPFFTTKPGGSGIGLVLARQIVDAHGGSLSLANREDGRGTVARLRIKTGGRSG